MDFFKMMKLFSRAFGRGKRQWRPLRRWLKKHPNHPSLPGGEETADQVIDRLYKYRWWNRKGGKNE